jgi:hypothetical protein
MGQEPVRKDLYFQLADFSSEDDHFRHTRHAE